MPQTMAMDMATQAANIELAKAQAEKAKAEATKISGVDTKLAETNIQSLTQGIAESKTKTRLLNVQADVEEWNDLILTATYKDLVEQAETTTKNMKAGLRSIEIDNSIKDATKEERINIIRGELLSIEFSNEILKIRPEEKK